MSNTSKQDIHPLPLDRDEAILLYYTLIGALGNLQEGQKNKAEGYTGEEIEAEIGEVKTLIAKVKTLLNEYPAWRVDPLKNKK